MSDSMDGKPDNAAGGAPAPKRQAAEATGRVPSWRTSASDTTTAATKPPPDPTTKPRSASTGRPAHDGARMTADRVGMIVAAAEQAAEEIRRRTEARMRDRIAEGDRAAQNRITAAEQEALDIVKNALEEAERAKTVAASEALSILAKAHDDADRTLKEAEAVKTASDAAAMAVLERAKQEAEAHSSKAKAQSREILGEARVAAADVRSEGMELVENLREMGDSLRSNAELLLGDIQAVHARMVAELDRVDGGASRLPAPRANERGSTGRRDSRGSAPDATNDVDRLEIPEFIPPG